MVDMLCTGTYIATSFPGFSPTRCLVTPHQDIQCTWIHAIPILNPLTADQKGVKTPSSDFLVLRVLIRGKE